MIELLEEACGRKAEIELLPMQPGDVAETFADISAIQTDLGFRAAHADQRRRSPVRRMVQGISGRPRGAGRRRQPTHRAAV